jgi:dienelactone hydrolase/cytochrome c553
MTMRIAASGYGLVCVMLSSVGDAHAQETAHPPAWFNAADKNGDGKLSLEEAPNKAVFSDVDTDGDGFASLVEVNAWLAKQPKPAATPPSSGSERASNAPQPSGRPSPAAALPDDVEKRPVVIFSDGTRMAGDLYLPKDRQPDEKFPAVVLCAGTGGTKGGTQARVAPIFARNGFVVLAFDYRGWGESESQLMAVDPQPKPDADNEMTIKVKALRWQMNYTDQTEDIRAAISFLAGEPTVDKDRIGLWGSSYGGGLVTTMAALDPRVKCVAAQVPGMGGRAPRAVAAALDLHTKQARGETEPVPIETGKMTGKMERYSNMRVNPAKSVGFNAVEGAERITSPIIFIVAENEELSSNDNVEAVHKGLLERGVPSAYHVIKGITHYGIYREGFEEATQLELAFFLKHLQDAPETAASTPTASEKSDSKPKLATPAPAEQPQPPAGTRRPADPETVFQFLDADKDSLLSETEIGKLKESVPFFRDNLQAIAPFFKQLDADGSGTLTLDEYRKVRSLPRQRPANRPAETPQRPEPETPATQPKTAEAAARPNHAQAANLAHFEKKIRPVLVAQCYSCHAADSKEIKGGLVLDTRDGIRKGGDSGPAVVPGDVSASFLIAAIRHDDGLEMPPKSKLTDVQIADFVKWIEAGAIDPREGKSPIASAGIDIEQGRDFWAFQRPVKTSPPQVQDESWPLTDIDRFVLAALERQGLAPVRDAEPAALLRRVHVDLTGLPPTAEELHAYLADPTPNRLQDVVDELLKSLRFGERWGRHWLDVARFAESSGKETDIAYPHAWRYRDYVIAAFNADKPFDLFIREQIAGDLLPARNDQERAERLIATGFLAIGPKGHGEKNPLKFEMDLVDEQIDVVSQAFLGMTIACARCHDHKYDPISQRDYYALAGIFRSTDTRFGTARMAMNGNANPAVQLPRGAKLPDAVSPLTPAQRQRIQQTIADLGSQMNALAAQGRTSSGTYVITMLKKQTETARLALFEMDGTPKRLAICAHESEEPRDSELFVRGEVDRPGGVVPRGLPSLARSSTSITQGSGRRELADWIASPENTLTARVIVNRVWLHLFGQGLVATPDNFGLSGQAPSNLELLDHLAAQFIQQGWSIKTLIRELMISRVYSLSTDRDARSFEVDPDNTLLWRMTPRRLDAECVRDAMLFTAGTLNLTPPVGSPIGAYGDGHVTGAQVQIGGPPDQLSKHRSVYLPVIRNAPLESLALFDMASGTVVTGQRPQTTVPAQSLYLLNRPYVMKLSDVAGQRLIADRPRDERQRLQLAYERFFNRSPTKAESQAGLDFVKRHASAELGWAALCRAMWASHDFLTRH